MPSIGCRRRRGSQTATLTVFNTPRLFFLCFSQWILFDCLLPRLVLGIYLSLPST